MGALEGALDAARFLVGQPGCLKELMEVRKRAVAVLESPITLLEQEILDAEDPFFESIGEGQELLEAEAGLEDRLEDLLLALLNAPKQLDLALSGQERL